jgi:antibiotic biosynthesis monooxygenase (ABM) superfamily enzyme
MPDASHLLVVTATVDPAVEKDWNDWYDNKHLPEISDCPGFLSGARYMAADEGGRRHYLAVYELADPNALKSAEFAARRGWGPFVGKVTYGSRCYSLLNSTSQKKEQR